MEEKHREYYIFLSLFKNIFQSYETPNWNQREIFDKFACVEKV